MGFIENKELEAMQFACAYNEYQNIKNLISNPDAIDKILNEIESASDGPSILELKNLFSKTVISEIQKALAKALV
jgi:hypothetical protein